MLGVGCSQISSRAPIEIETPDAAQKFPHAACAGDIPVFEAIVISAKFDQLRACCGFMLCHMSCCITSTFP